MKPLISYYGGKQNLLDVILPNIPPHKTYIEPFCGGAAVFWAKPLAEVNYINDTNEELINMYRMVKTRGAEVWEYIQGTLYSRAEHDKAKHAYNNPEQYTEVERAALLIINAMQGFSSIINTAWAQENGNIRRNLWNNYRARKIMPYMKKLEAAHVEKMDGAELIKRRGHKDAFIFVDPPYIDTDCAHYEGYTQQDLLNLIEALEQTKGKFMLCHYPNETISDAAKANGWCLIEKRQPLAVDARSETKYKTEVMIANYPISLTGGYNQTSLFGTDM